MAGSLLRAVLVTTPSNATRILALIAERLAPPCSRVPEAVTTEPQKVSTSDRSCTTREDFDKNLLLLFPIFHLVRSQTADALLPHQALPLSLGTYRSNMGLADILQMTVYT